MNTNTFFFAVVPVSLLMVACTPLTPNLDSSFGTAVNQAKVQQTLNPDASQNVEPVTGVSGTEGNLAVDAYHKSLEKTEPTTTIINIGGGLTGN